MPPHHHEEVALQEADGRPARAARAQGGPPAEHHLLLGAVAQGGHHATHEGVEHPSVEHLGAVDGEHQGLADQASVAQRVHPTRHRRCDLRILGEDLGGELLAGERLPEGQAVCHQHPHRLDGRELDATGQGGQCAGIRPVIARRCSVVAATIAPGAGRAEQRSEEQQGGEPSAPAPRPRLVVLDGHGAGQPTRRVLWLAMQETLEQLLADLKDAIDASGEGADNKDELARLAGELERRLSDDDPEGVVDELREEVTRFEASHPNLAAAIGRAADALSAIGL